ncbi:AAA family ATPase [Candidatus Chromulinivorax destructor]|uniref:ATPase AAA-type core domain-containing protein n=1 Tax=Candidatus Chromulinivorax destructor TaxID=2066483 RepID=A0A345ZCE6_9BACT|nr:AAA family ATPase [Candidatus Chromulinivorax destructor]AXK60963.1 hypothetical protein C0J27_04485 [Candidatus Chromulinivorax destructor]
MKKHTKLRLIFGIVILNGSLSIASDNDNGAGSPAKLIPAIVTFLKASTIAAVSHIITTEFVESWRRSKKSSESYWEYFTASKPKLATITHEQLKLRPDLHIDTLASLPEAVQSVLHKEEISGTGEHQMLLLYGKPGTGKTTIAQQIALYTKGNYYHIHQRDFDNYSDATVARFLRYYVQRIADETKDGTVSTLHLEEFGKQFGLSTGNEIQSVQHGMNENTWKSLLQDLEKNYPKVRVVACSNYGQDGKPFNSAIANERAHIINVQAPNDVARKVFLTTTCVAHLKNQGTKHAEFQTASKKNQKNRNKFLTDTFLVTNAMHDACKKEHDDKIAMITPHSLSAYIWPSKWVSTWNKRVQAANLQSQGYHTPVVNWDVAHATEKEINKFVAVTNGLRYRQLNEITEDARRDKLEQIERMKKHATNNDSTYKVDLINRTFSLTTIDYNPKNPSEKKELTITAPFGKVQPHNMVQAAAKDIPNNGPQAKPITDIYSMAKRYEQKKNIEKLKLKAPAHVDLA